MTTTYKAPPTFEYDMTIVEEVRECVNDNIEESLSNIQTLLEDLQIILILERAKA